MLFNYTLSILYPATGPHSSKIYNRFPNVASQSFLFRQNVPLLGKQV